MLFNANTFLNRVLDHHEEYGIRNATGYCAAYDQPYINTDPGMYGCLPLEEYLCVSSPSALIPPFLLAHTDTHVLNPAGSTQAT